MRVAPILGVLAATSGVAFGYFGGEYGTPDLRSLRRDLAAERGAVARLEAEMDSLRVEAVALETDPVTQERVARERFGMVRDGERLFRVRFDAREP